MEFLQNLWTLGRSVAQDIHSNAIPSGDPEVSVDDIQSDAHSDVIGSDPNVDDREVIGSDTNVDDEEQCGVSDPNVDDDEEECVDCVPTLDFAIGKSFQTLKAALAAAQEFAQVPLTQSSSKGGQYIYFKCFRMGAAKASISTEERKRKKYTRRCDCKFMINLVKHEGSFVVRGMHASHNHVVLTENEIAALPQSRFIPEPVQQTLRELADFGKYTTSQINDMIQTIHHKDVPVTWNLRDIQNLSAKFRESRSEASTFVKLLESKKNEEDGWSVLYVVNDENMRLERVFWMSGEGKGKYEEYNDVIEIDATYKTNRFGMPLVLVTGLDRNGITFLICGCLLSDEKQASYQWCLDSFKKVTNSVPDVIFSDGDENIAHAINRAYPQTVHQLCRFHIAQNVQKKLAGKLRTEMTEFLSLFWKAASLESINSFQSAMEVIITRWPQSQSYMQFLMRTKEKWAFAYTHRVFVAGVASTQRQESMNWRIKSQLIRSSELRHLLSAFTEIEEKTRQKMTKAMLQEKIFSLTPDPLIQSALEKLSHFAGNLLREQASQSLSYSCESRGVNQYVVCHKDTGSQPRNVVVDESSNVFACSCRKHVWHGIPCRHILCCLRHVGIFHVPVNLLNHRWFKEDTSILHNKFPNCAVTGPSIYQESERGGDVMERERFATLSGIARNIINRSIGDAYQYESTKDSLSALESMVLRASAMECETARETESLNVLNPVPVRTKGRPKTGEKRMRCQHDKGKRRRRVCSKCGEPGHDTRTCQVDDLKGDRRQDNSSSDDDESDGVRGSWATNTI
jgi:zinc finger SWIM domain-containing protein 3